MLMVTLLLQFQVGATDANYSSPSLRTFVLAAARENRVPPADLAGYAANVESEIALILRDSLGRELVGQVEQLAARADWNRDGAYQVHVVGFRSQHLGSPYSALTFTRMYTVPTLYGNRLVIGMNDGLPRTRKDTVLALRAAHRDSLAGRERFRAVHPLATDRDRYYRFSGGDTVATVYLRGRAIRLTRITVEPVRRSGSNFLGFRGELFFDADRQQLVRMRGHLEDATPDARPLLARTTGAVAVAFMEFENVEVDGRYWLPAYQRTEFQGQVALLGETRSIYRLVSRFSDYAIRRDSAGQLLVADTMARTRARLTFASRDSVSRFDTWRENIGTASGRVDGGDFADLAPNAWRPSGHPLVSFAPHHLPDILRYNRVEGLFTGMAASVRFRDAFPGLSARGHLGMGWESRSVRGGASLSLARPGWIHAARAERTLASTNDFPLGGESGTSLGPLLGGYDDHDYVDRWTLALSTTRVFRNVDRALLTVEGAVVEDRAEVARLKNGVFGSEPFRPNRNVLPGRYARATARLTWHPGVSGEALSPGVGARLLYELAAGDLDWTRVEARVAARSYWHGLVFATRVDAGALFGDVPPPQLVYELGGARDLPAYEYKEFGGDRAVAGRGLVAYHFPVARSPVRIRSIVFPGLSPGIGVGIHGGWTGVASDAGRTALLALGGDGGTPLSRPSDRVRATADVRLTLLSGTIGLGLSSPLDRPARWLPFFVWGAAF